MSLKRKNEGRNTGMQEAEDKDTSRDLGAGPSQFHLEGQERLIKRARQACSNCRQKKIRCSGDHPCKLCVKLSQECRFNSVDQERPQRAASSLTDQYTTLPLRMAMIESKVEEIMLRMQGSKSESSSRMNNAAADEPSAPINVDAMIFDAYQNGTNHCRGIDLVVQPNPGSWAVVPPQPVLTASCDVYFTYCHNQPYSYFHEETFRRKVTEGLVPEYLLFAVLAMALRFSTDPYWQGMQAGAADAYASASWKLIVSQQLIQEDGMNLQVVQAANILAVIDFTASRLRLAWMKIGLAIRVAQDLRLMYETDPDTKLSLIEQEEQRRVFWSVYLLDKLVSCGQARPLAVLNSDCQVLLPCDEFAFRQGLQQKSQTINELLHESGSSTHQPSAFAMTILMASHLGSCVRDSLQGGANDEYPPWDSRSRFAHIKSALTNIESYADLSKGVLSAEEAATNVIAVDGKIDKQRRKHLFFAHALFHLSQCLLHHPFLLRKRLEMSSRAIPQRFLSVAFQTATQHAGMLSNVLEEAGSSDLLIGPSFYSYCLTVSSTIHCLFLNSNDSSVQQVSRQHLQTNLQLLHSMSRYWNHAALMCAALARFQANLDRYGNLVDTSLLLPDERINAADAEELWSLVDYGLMSKQPAPVVISSSQIAISEWTLDSWFAGEEGLDAAQFFGESEIPVEEGSDKTNHDSVVFSFD